MTDDMMNLRRLVEKTPDADLLREMIGGPAKEAGYYILPFCDPMCCRPDGPFPDKDAALAYARAQKIDLSAEETAKERRLSGRDPDADNLEELMRQELEKLERQDAPKEC